MTSLRYALLAVAFLGLSGSRLPAAVRAPLQARETVLSNIRTTFTNDGSVGYGFDRMRRGGIWPRDGARGYFDVGGLWLACRKRVGGTLRDVCLVGVDPRTRKRSFTPGSREDNRTAPDSVLFERAQLFSSAFVESPNLDPLTTHVWPVRSVNGVRTVVLDARARGNSPRYEVGDEDLFALYSDADSSKILFPAAGLPLQIDVEQTGHTWYVDSLSNVIVLEYKITNRSQDTLFAPCAAAVFGVSVGDTTAPANARNDRAKLLSFDSASVVVAGDTTGFSVLSFAGLDGNELYHDWRMDSLPADPAARAALLRSESKVDETLPYPVVSVSRNFPACPPGGTLTMRTAIVISADGSALISDIRRVRAVGARGFDSTRTMSLGVLDAEVSDSITSLAVPYANIHVEERSGNALIRPFDVLTDLSGSARIRIPDGKEFYAVASARGYAGNLQHFFSNTGDAVVPFLLQKLVTQDLTPSSPSPLQLGSFWATARIAFTKRAALRQGHKIQVITDGLITGMADINPVTMIPYHVVDATTREVLLRDTLNTNLHSCGDFPDTVVSQRTVLVDSSIEITLSMRGQQELEGATISSYRHAAGVDDVALTIIGADSAHVADQCTYAAAGSGSYAVTFQPGGSTLVRVGKYLLDMPYLNAQVVQGGTAILQRGDRRDTLNAGLWTMRVGAWKRRTGEFLGYPCFDQDSEQCEFFGRYFQGISLEPLEHDSIVFAHCITINGNRFGIDFSNKGIPSVAPWPRASTMPQRDVDTTTTIAVSFTGGINAAFPFDSAIISFQLPENMSGVAQSPLVAQFEMYPVPVNDIAHVRTASPAAQRVRVIDALGRTVFDGIAGGTDQLNVRMAELPAGVYTMSITGAQREERRQFVVVH